MCYYRSLNFMLKQLPLRTHFWGTKVEFRSKIDKHFVIILSFAVLLVLAVFLIPLFLDDKKTTIDTLIVLTICMLTIGFILWTTFSVKYIFREDHLFVKAGLFRSRIPYEKITKVSPTTEIYTGYRLLSSKYALEIFYETAVLGSVKISPKDRELFISELKKRCPKIQFVKQ